jgi:hypothetical protein
LRSYLNNRYRKLSLAGIHLLFQPALLRQLRGVRQKALILGVYSYDNVAVLHRIIEEAEHWHWEVRLWALDRIHPSVARYCRGAGKGPKFPLLNRLTRDCNLPGFDWVVVTDDDVLFEYGSLATFLSIADRAGMNLAQPAHASRSFVNHKITVREPLSIARLTTFVEIGPLFAIKRDCYDKFLPFPESMGMGWGLDIKWTDLQANGARFGIVDWVTLHHLRPLGSAGTYDMRPELIRMEELLRARGHHSLAELQKTVATWHVWQGSPPWLRSST